MPIRAPRGSTAPPGSTTLAAGAAQGTVGAAMGSATMTTAAGIAVLVGMGALALDLGYMNMALNQVQAAADAGALAGAISIAQGESNRAVWSSSIGWAQSNNVGRTPVVVEDGDVRRGT